MKFYGEDFLKNLLIDYFYFSLPITQCKQKYPSMDVEIRKEVKGWIESISEKYGYVYISEKYEFVY